MPTNPILSEPPLSEDFPYIVTRIAPAMYHVIPLPEDFSEHEQLLIAERQVVANKLETCLALRPDRSFYFLPRSNRAPEPAETPRGGLPICDKLRPVPEVFHQPSVAERIERLSQIFERKIKGAVGFCFGDLSKGNRKATQADILRLKGFHNGIPIGLELCDSCGEYRGECLDPGEKFAGTVATVHCLCENDNLCAYCEQPLADSRLNANTFNREDGQIWHQPGFAAFHHVCAS